MTSPGEDGNQVLINHPGLSHRASQSEMFKSTLIAEDPKTRKRARLSWYHPDDTVCCLAVVSLLIC